MTLAELIPPEHIFLRVPASDKPALLGELARRAAASVGLQSAALASRLAEREALGSTGVGGGFAVPHARIEGLGRLTGFFARLERPVDYAAIDGKPIDLVFMLLSPPNGTAEHLAALAAVSRRLRDKSVADSIRRAPNADAMRQALIGVP